jgi:hypothetical protein
MMARFLNGSGERDRRCENGPMRHLIEVGRASARLCPPDDAQNHPLVWDSSYNWRAEARPTSRCPLFTQSGGLAATCLGRK